MTNSSGITPLDLRRRAVIVIVISVILSISFAVGCMVAMYMLPPVHAKVVVSVATVVFSTATIGIVLYLSGAFVDKLSPMDESNSNKSPSKLSTPEAMTDGFISVSEASEMLDISRQSVVNAIGGGRLGAKKVGVVFLVDIASVRAYQDSSDELVSPHHTPDDDHDANEPLITEVHVNVDLGDGVMTKMVVTNVVRRTLVMMCIKDTRGRIVMHPDDVYSLTATAVTEITETGHSPSGDGTWSFFGMNVSMDESVQRGSIHVHSSDSSGMLPPGRRVD